MTERFIGFGILREYSRVSVSIGVTSSISNDTREAIVDALLSNREHAMPMMFYDGRLATDYLSERTSSRRDPDVAEAEREQANDSSTSIAVSGRESATLSA